MSDVLNGKIDLAFDHLRIVRDAVERVRVELEVTGIATAFVGTDVHPGRAARGVRGRLGRPARRRELPAERRRGGGLGDSDRATRQARAGRRPARRALSSRTGVEATADRSIVPQRTERGDDNESGRPRPVRAAGGPATRGGRAAGAQGRRGSRQDPRHDGQQDRLPDFAAPSTSSAASSPACVGRSGGSSAWSWPERSRPSARAVTEFEVGDHVFGVTGSGAHAEFVCMRESAALAHMPAGMTFEEAAAVCDGAALALACLGKGGARGPEHRRLRRLRIGRHCSGAAGQALRRPRHRRLQHEERRARADRSEPTRSSTTCKRTSRRTARPTTSSSTLSTSTRSGGVDAR